MNILVSGIQPTGQLHLGNYLGAIKNWLELQKKYQCFFFIADLHALTTKISAAELKKQTFEIIVDLLALGLDPKKAVIFRQSDIIGHAELTWIFNCLIPVAELNRMTQFKDKSKMQPDNINAGLLTYPVLQAADILLYKGEVVPVGEDQLQHLELSCKLARKFNHRYGQFFAEIQPILSPTPRLMSLNNPEKKMSKSLGEKSYVAIRDSKDIVSQKIKKAVADKKGVENLLNEIIKSIPPPKIEFEGNESLRALVFDFKYSNHQGIIVYVRVLDGKFTKNLELEFGVSKETFIPSEVGVFLPEQIPKESLESGEIGYIITGIKKPGLSSVGDTITSKLKPMPVLPGYMTPRPVVWASLYPEESQDDFSQLKIALGRLKLSDPSLSFEEETSGALGRGFRCGFLGMLHLEIIIERLKREFNLALIVTSPSINYKIIYTNGKEDMIYSPHTFPDDGLIAKVLEPWVKVKIIIPMDYLGPLMPMLFLHEAVIGETENFGGNRSVFNLEMPLRELMRNFFDELKSISSGYASISYKMSDFREADVVRLDILVADEVVPAFSRVVSRRRIQEEAENSVEKLHNVLPRQLFVVKIQGKALGRILSSQSLSALKKDVTGYLYGGDRTRKMKLWAKQKKGKKKLKERGKVNIPHDVFLKMMKRDKD